MAYNLRPLKINVSITYWVRKINFSLVLRESVYKLQPNI